MNLKLLLKAANAEKESFDWGELTWNANAKLGNSKLMTLGKCIINVNAENPRHYHPNCEEILYVTQGKLLHTLDDNSFEMQTGDTIVIPANVWHNARNIGDEDAIMTIVYSSAHRETVGE